MQDYAYLIWFLVVGAVFAFMWRKGHLLRLSNYVLQTKEELKKCSWPSLEELRGSTVVVMITIILLGGFTVGVDSIIAALVRLIL